MVNQTLRQFLTSRPPITSYSSETETQTEKEQYSLVINYISEEEGYEKGAEVLMVGHETLANKEKSFIAQTLARFNIKHKKFAEAIQWGEEAVDIAIPYNKGACLDTLGQCHKNALREIRGNFQGLYKIENLDKAVYHASEACNNFMKSRDAQKSTRGEFARRYWADNDAGISLNDIEQASSGLCGLAEVCLSIVRAIIMTEDFVRSEGLAARAIFIKILRSPEEDSIKFLAQELEQRQLKILSKFWKDNYDNLFSHLFTITKFCIVHAVRLMTDNQIKVRSI